MSKLPTQSIASKPAAGFTKASPSGAPKAGGPKIGGSKPAPSPYAKTPASLGGTSNQSPYGKTPARVGFVKAKPNPLAAKAGPSISAARAFSPRKAGQAGGVAAASHPAAPKPAAAPKFTPPKPSGSTVANGKDFQVSTKAGRVLGAQNAFKKNEVVGPKGPKRSPQEAIKSFEALRAKDQGKNVPGYK